MTIKKIPPVVSATYAGYSGQYDKIIKEQANIKEEDYSSSEKIKKILDEKRKMVQPVCDTREKPIKNYDENYNVRGKKIKNYNDEISSVDIKI